MDRNTAIVKIILGSAEAIRSMALDAIDHLDEGAATFSTLDTVGDLSHGESLTLDPAFAKQFLDAIDATTTKVVGTEGIASLTPASTESEAAEKKRRGRPRKADTEGAKPKEAPSVKEVLESAPTPEPEEADEGDAPVATADSFDDEPATTPEPEEPSPEQMANADGWVEITLDWVKANKDAAVEKARNRASAHVSKGGPNFARTFLKDATGKIRISDCTDEELVTYLNAPEKDAE